MPLNSQSEKDSSFDKMTRYVRVRSTSDAKFVEFDFAINDPNLFVELVLPKDAFRAFCEKNSVVMMTQEQGELVDASMKKWRYGDDTLMNENHNKKFIAI